MNEYRIPITEARALNAATQALGLGLAGMTQLRWDLLSISEKLQLVDESGLHPQLIGFEGGRVEVITMDGAKRRFWVSRSSGWRPCHIERKLRTSHGGVGISRSEQFKSVLFVVSNHGKVYR